MCLEPDRAPTLIHEISTKASGVFLWVFLVVRSLREGLSNGDGITDLQERVDRLPADLEDYAMHILGGVDSFYVKQAAELFRMALDSDQDLLLHTYSFLAYNKDSESGLKAPTMAPLNHEQVASRYDERERRLNSRCKGLLEVSDDGYSANLADSLSGRFRVVGFLHRTVRDILETPTMRYRFVANDAQGICWARVFLQAHIAQIKLLQYNPHIDTHPTIQRVVRQAISVLRRFNNSSFSPKAALIDEFDHSVWAYCKSVKVPPRSSSKSHSLHWTNDWMTGGPHSFFSFAATIGLKSYI